MQSRIHQAAILISLASLLPLAAHPQMSTNDAPLLSRNEAYRLLHKLSDDRMGNDPHSIRSLIEAGPRAHSALGEILNEPDVSRGEVYHIMRVFTESEGDKSLARVLTRGALAAWSTNLESRLIGCCIQLVQCLEKIGDSNDVQILNKYIDHPDYQLRVQIYESLAHIGSAESYAKICRHIVQREKSIKAGTMLGDDSLESARRAATGIRERLNLPAYDPYRSARIALICIGVSGLCLLVVWLLRRRLPT